MAHQPPPSPPSDSQAGTRQRLLAWLRRFRPSPGTYVSAFCIGAALAEAISGAPTPEAGLVSLAAALGANLLADLLGDWHPSMGQSPEAMAEQIAERVQTRLALGEGLAAASEVLQGLGAFWLAFQAWQREEDDRWVWLVNELAGQPELVADKAAAKLLPRLANIEDRLACVQNLLKTQAHPAAAPPPSALRVFISGTMDDLQSERTAVDEAILHLLLRPVRAENMGSQSRPSRDAILRALQECDIYLGVYGGRYGWQIPELGISVTEFEFDEARRLGKPALIYVKDIASPEERQDAFVRRVQDFDAGYFRRPRFSVPEELANWVQQDLSALLAEWARDPDRVLRRQLARDYAYEVSRRFEEWRSAYVALQARAAPVSLPRLAPDHTERAFRRSEFLPVGARVDYRQVTVSRGETKTYDDARQALTEVGDAVLLGRPGAGKSTTLWRIMLDYAERAGQDPDAPLPVLVPLGGYDGRIEFLEHVRSRLAGARIEVTLDQYEPLPAHRRLAPHLEEELAEGRLALLLDGLNEMPQDTVGMALSELRRFRANHPGNRYVFTCRERDDAPLGLPEVRLESLDDQAIRTFVRAYLPPGEAYGMLEQLRRDGSLWELGRSPYLLTIMILVHAQEGSLPANRADLFGQFVSSLLLRERKGQPDCFHVAHHELRAERLSDSVEWLSQRWLPLREWIQRPETFRLGGATLADLSRADQQALSVEAGLFVMALAEFAYHMGKTGLFGSTVAHRFVEEYLPRQVAIGGYRIRLGQERLLNLARSAGVLDSTTDGVRFAHQLLQDYFAAVHLSILGIESPELQECMRYDAWDETVELLAGMGQEASGLVERLIPLTPFLAARCARVAAGGPKEDLATCLVDTLATEMMDESSAWREEAIEALGRTGLRDALPVICSALPSDSARVRLAVTRALGATGLEEAVPTLIKQLLDTEAPVRWAAVEGLKSVRSSSAISALLELATHDELPVRWAAVEVLGGLGSRDAVPALIDRLRDDDRGVRVTAILAIKALEAHEAIPALMERLSDEDAVVQHAAAEALESLQAGFVAPSLADWPDEETLVKWTLGASISTVASSQSDVRPMALNWLEERRSRERRAAVGLLAAGEAASRQETISAVLDRLKSGTIMVPLDAIADLERLHAQETIPTLVDWLGHDRALVRWAAIMALERLRARQATPALIDRLRDEDAYVQQAAANALATLQAKEAIPALLAQSQSEDYRVQLAVGSALGVLQGREIVPMLLGWLRDENPSVRWAAIHVLTELKAEDKIAALALRLDDDDPSVRVAAAGALETLRAAETVPLLVLLGWAGRAEAWDALAQMKQDSIVGTLQSLSQYPDISVRAAALRASEKARREAGLPRSSAWQQTRTTRASRWTLVDQSEEALAFVPDWRIAVLAQTQNLLSLGCAAAALTVVDRHEARVRQDPRSRDVLDLLSVQRARCLAMLGRCTEALAVARVLAERLRDSVSYLGHVAHVFASLGRPEEAGRLYERCVQLDNGPAQHRDLARWHIQQGNYMDAEQCIVSAAKDEPWHSSTFGLRGQLALAHGCFTEALIALKEASDRDCHEIAWRFDLAFAQLGSSEPDALTTFDSALESTELQEQVESALQDLQLLERAQPGLPQLGDIRSQLESRQDSLNRLAEEELQGRSPTWEAGSA